MLTSVSHTLLTVSLHYQSKLNKERHVLLLYPLLLCYHTTTTSSGFFPRRSLSHRFTFIYLRQFPATHFVNKHLLVIIDSYQLFYSTKTDWNAESDSYTERQSNARVSYDSIPIKGGSTGTLRKKERKTVFSHTYVLVRKRERKGSFQS